MGRYSLEENLNLTQRLRFGFMTACHDIRAEACFAIRRKTECARAVDYCD
jgi:hypothetical protein